MINYLKKFNDKKLNQLKIDNNARKSQVSLIEAVTKTIDIATDITNILKDKVDDYKSQLNIIGDLINEAFFMISENGTIETFNKGAENIFHYSSEEILGKNINLILKCKIMNNDTCAAITKHNTKISVNLKVNEVILSDNSIHFLLYIEDISEYNKLLNKYKAILESSNDLILIVDYNNIITSIWDPCSFNNILISHDYLEKSILSISDLYIKSFLKSIISKTIETKKLLTYNFSYHSNNKLYLYECISKNINHNEILISIKDITNIIELKNDLKKKELFYETYNFSPDEYIIIHDKLNIYEYNKNFEKFMNIIPNQSFLNYLQIFHPLERNRISSMNFNNLEINYETIIQNNNGDNINVEIKSKLIEWNNKPARLSVIYDISKYYNRDNVLKITNDRYNSIVNNTIDLYCCFETDLNITFANRSFNEYFYNISFSNLSQIIYKDDIHLFKMTLQNIEEINRLLFRIKINDEFRWLDSIIKLNYKIENKIEYTIICRDVTSYINKLTKREY